MSGKRGTNLSEDQYPVRMKRPFILSQFLYNADEGTVLDRDSSSWGKLDVICDSLHHLMLLIQLHNRYL